MDTSNYNFLRIIKRIMPEIEKEINQKIKAKLSVGKYNKTKFLEDVKDNKEYFPIKEDTYRKYLTMSNNKKNQYSTQSMKTIVLFDICEYTGVSADYYLGFIDTKKKEASAPQVKQDFGLSDKAMDTLSQINNHKAEEKGELSADVVNYIFEDKDFWEELNAKLPVYISALVYNLDDANTDAARYGVMRAFETLLNHLSEKCINSDLRNAKVDQLAPFQSDII